MRGGWLQRSRQEWKVYSSRGALVLGLGCLVLAGLLHRRDAGAYLTLLSCFLISLSYGLAMLVSCPICGVQLVTSRAAREMPRRRRTLWVEGLARCPVCGDDGNATDRARRGWVLAGGAGEPPEWTPLRAVLVLVAVLLMLGALLVWGSVYQVRL